MRKRSLSARTATVSTALMLTFAVVSVAACDRTSDTADVATSSSPNCGDY